MHSQSILAVAWLASIATIVVAAVAVWRLRRSHFRPGPLTWFWSFLIAVAWAAGTWGALIEPELLVVRRVTVMSNNWTGPPLRIGLISDTHAGAAHGGLRRLASAMRRMNDQHPDLVLLLGDYAGSHKAAHDRSERQNAEVMGGVAVFGMLKAPLGVVGVLGNHDFWYDQSAIHAGLQKAGVEVLVDRAVRIRRPGGEFWIAGVNSLDDFRAPPDLTKAMANIPPGTPAILAMHEPDLFAKAPGTLALTVAGHTHCGQVNLPLIGRPVLPGSGSRRWPCHYYDEGGRKLFVSGGVGTSILPVRVGAPPEIVIVTLRQGHG